MIPPLGLITKEDHSCDTIPFGQIGVSVLLLACVIDGIIPRVPHLFTLDIKITPSMSLV